MRIQRSIQLSRFKAKHVRVEVRNQFSLEIWESHFPQSYPQSELFQVVKHIEFFVEPRQPLPNNEILIGVLPQTLEALPKHIQKWKVKVPHWEDPLFYGLDFVFGGVFLLFVFRLSGSGRVFWLHIEEELLHDHELIEDLLNLPGQKGKEHRDHRHYSTSVW